MVSEDHVGQQFRLYRGEGSHDRPSYYPDKGPNALAGALAAHAAGLPLPYRVVGTARQ